MILNWIRSHFHPLWHLRRHSRLFRWATRNVRIKVGIRVKNVDHKLYVDLLRNPHMLGSPDKYEREDLDLMINLIGRLKLSRMFDVGANLGLYAFAFSATAHDGRIVAFEPDEVNAKLFDTSNARCPRRNIVLERKAVSATSGSAAFLSDDMSGATGSLNQESNSFVERNYGGTPSRKTVETTTIDEASKRFFPPDFIKIDVEGAELSVLEGAKETLATTRPIMLIEINTEAALERVRELLNGVDYSLRATTAPNYLAYPRQVKIGG